MRLFVAIDLDDSTRAAVGQVIERLRRRLRSAAIKWVAPSNLHVTLQFIGYVNEETSVRIREVLAPDLTVPSFEARIAGVGVFPPRGSPRVIWCGVEDRTGRLASVQKEVEQRLVAAAHIEPESRPYHAHVTVGRYREAGSAAVRRILEATHVGELGRYRVEEVTLYESKLSPRGPTYHAIAATRLSDTIRSVP